MVFFNGEPRFTKNDMSNLQIIEMTEDEKAKIKDKYFLMGVVFSIIITEINVIGIMLTGGGKYALVDRELAPVYLLLLLVQILALCTALRLRCQDKISLRRIEGYLEKKEGYEDELIWRSYSTMCKVKRVYMVIMKDKNSDYSTRVYVTRHKYKHLEIGDELSLTVKWSD